MNGPAEPAGPVLRITSSVDDRGRLTLSIFADSERIASESVDGRSPREWQRCVENLAELYPVLSDADTRERIYEALRDAAGRHSGKATTPGDDASEATPTDQARRRSKAEVATALAIERCEFFASNETDDSYAAFPSNGHRETWPVESKGFRQWLHNEFYRQEAKHIGGQALKDTIEGLAARGRYSGVKQPVFLRVAPTDEEVVIDTGDDAWSAIRVTADGVERVERPAVHFIRTPTMKPLPPLDLDGKIDELEPFVNVESETEFRLVVGWLLAALAGEPPFPILVLNGEQGSGKSTLARMLRSFVDPSSFELRSMPREERDLVAAARNGWTLIFDNLSAIPEWLSDGLCRVATGGGLGGRRLYTDDTEHVFDATRPVILNGIPDLIYRPDLASRCLVVRLRSLDRARKTVRELSREFEEALPRIFGELLRGLSASRRNRDKTHLDQLPRLADFAELVTASEEGLGWKEGTFVEALAESLRAMRADALADEPLFDALMAFRLNRTEWRGTASKLHADLTRQTASTVTSSNAWPKTPATLGNRLRRIAPLAREVGLEIEFDRSGETRTVVLRWRGRDTGPKTPS